MRPAAELLLDTIVALATPAGRSAIAVLRLSGPRAREILTAVAPRLSEPLEPRRATLATLEDPSGETIDHGLVTFFPAAASYTGEDTAEISVHGSPVIIERLLSVIARAGARLAFAGEFTERAFLHGKMDLLRAEAVSDLISSRTSRAAQFSLKRLEGGLSRRLRAVREQLLAAAASLGATLDFAEDVGEAVPADVAPRLLRAVTELEHLLSTYEAARLLRAGCRVAILGRPNAGKSTLFNKLAGSARAIVTEIPGTTRDALEVEVDVGGIPVTVVDTAGLRATEDPVERIGVERARAEAERADLLLYVLDASQGMTDEDRAALESVGERPVLRIANKRDLATSEQAGSIGAGATPLCGLREDAGQVLRALLARQIASRVDTASSFEALASVRQRDLTVRAHAASARALESLDAGESPEYAASHVHEALDALADLFGETTSEDVLKRIFSTFCIGK